MSRNENAKASPVRVKHAKVFFPNFSDIENDGKRSFCLSVPEDIASDLASIGWNIKEDTYHDESEYYLNVAVSYKVKSPMIFLVMNGYKQVLTEESIWILDDYIKSGQVEDTDIRFVPSYWSRAGRSGIKGYLDKMYIFVRPDDMDDEYADIPYKS